MARPSLQPVKSLRRLYCLFMLLLSSVILWQAIHAMPRVSASSYPSSNLTSTISNSGDNWAGYEALGQAGTFTKAQTYFIIPSLHPSIQGVTSEWAGIGGESAVTHSPVLVQAGVDSIMDASGNQSNEAWIEVHDVYPSRYLHFIHGLHKGDGIYIYVESNVNHSGYDKFYIQNRTTHEALSYSLSGPQYISDGASGECILERLNQPLANFGKEKLSSCNLSDGKALSPIGSYLTTTKVNMVSNHGSKHPVMFANPEKLDKQGQAFFVTWRNP